MFKKFVLYIALFTSVLVYGLSDKQVSQVKKQIELLEQKKYQEYLHTKSNLKATNIDSYLQYKAISQNPEEFTQEQISDFFDNHKQEYWASALCDGLAIYYAKNNNWQMFKKFYDGDLESAGRCWSIAQKDTAQSFKRKAVIDFSRYHETKKYSAVECTDIDAYWDSKPSSNGKDCVVDKAYTLAFENSFDDALKLLDKNVKQQSYNEYIKSWKATTKDPHKLDDFILKYHNYPKFDEILIDISKDSAKSKPEQYAKIWQQLDNKDYLSKELRSNTIIPIAVGLAKAHKMQKAKEWFSKADSKYYDDNTWAWLLRTDIYNSNFKNYIQAYKRLPKKLQNEAAWLYWLAYSYTYIGDNLKAKGIYKKLSHKKGFNYYALLATDALGQEYVLGSDKVKLISDKETTKLLEDHNISQAISLYKAGQFKDSTRLWKWAIRSKFKSDQRAQIPKLAQLAWVNKMHYQAIFSMSMLGLDSHLELLFPNPFRDTVDDQSGKYDLEKSLIFSIMRQESLFYREASSSVGAKGLMQVTDSTAGFVAKRYKLKDIEKEVSKKIFFPKVNISVGSANLDFLDGLFKENIVLSIAAYNAGPGNVAKWLTDDEIPVKQRIESIPFGQTRHYVRSVLVNMVIYNDFILKDKKEKLSDLLEGEISNKLSFKK